MSPLNLIFLSLLFLFPRAWRRWAATICSPSGFLARRMFLLSLARGCQMHPFPFLLLLFTLLASNPLRATLFVSSAGWRSPFTFSLNGNFSFFAPQNTFFSRGECAFNGPRARDGAFFVVCQLCMRKCQMNFISTHFNCHVFNWRHL